MGRGASRAGLGSHSLFLPKPLLYEAEALSSLASEESLALEVEQQLGLEIQKLTAQIQVRRAGDLTGASFGVGGEVVVVVEQLSALESPLNVSFLALHFLSSLYYGNFKKIQK